MLIVNLTAFISFNPRSIFHTFQTSNGEVVKKHRASILLFFKSDKSCLNEYFALT